MYACRRAPGTGHADSVIVRPLFNLIGHEDAVIFGAFSPDSSVAATSSLDATLRLWSMQTGVYIYIYIYILFICVYIYIQTHM